MEKLIKQIMNQIREESKEIEEPFQQSPPLNTRPRRQRLQRNGQIWPGYEVIGEKTNLGRQRLQRKEKIWPGSEEVIGDGCHVSIRTETKKKLQDIRGNNPYPGSKVKDKAKEIVDDNKEIVANSISEGFEVIGDETSSINQEIRPRRQRLQRNGNIWPGSEVIVDDVQDSVPVDSGTNNMSSYGQKTKPGRQRLKRKEYIWPGSEVIGESGSILTYQKKKLEDLPAKCISLIISLTTPRAASRLALVCPAFRSAADSDSVWEKFLPSDYEGFISNSSLIDKKKKDLYFHLCRNPILFDNNTASFGLEQESGKKCYMAGAKWIYENSGISHRDCEMIPSSAGSRFPEVIELKLMSSLEIEARFGTTIFSPKTNYAAYFVFKFAEFREGPETSPIDFEVYFEGSHNGKKRREFLDPQLSQDRGNRWIEIKMGEFSIENGDEGTVVCRLSEPEPLSKRGTIIFQGIEVRPEYGR
ncbi:putative F-box protein PP2-B12 isoform X8 [Citrus sinensis]|uniref:putative F-box protein PP2-B12 isoform X8 n=1 Tax=Citrus sinensis TaxID=2711 RepID=UPI002279C945|nr:putative F-box protein PP2-B12 isoform X8 [Citrus sinensis]XP_052296553.1 putative F-box protein PP2-B12 isoform X8 [Citrus sinensis]